MLSLESKSELSKDEQKMINIIEIINDFKKYLQGRVLTIIDASTDDKEKRKALKDVITDAIWDREYYTKRVLMDAFDKDQYPTPETKIDDIQKKINEYTNSEYQYLLR